MSAYEEKLQQREWQICRAIIIKRDGGRCVACGTDQGPMNVHHGYYIAGAEPWEYPHETLWTLCADCHRTETYRRNCVAEALAKLRPRKDGLLLSLFRQYIASLQEWEEEMPVSDTCLLEPNPTSLEVTNG